MPKSRFVRAFSAGGVIFRRVAGAALPDDPGPDAPLEGVEVALVGRAAEDFWVLPKGTPKAGESHEQVALREVQEETGVAGRSLGEIDSIHYWFARHGVRFNKEVLYYLMEAAGGDVSLHDHEYDDARWFPIAQVSGRLAYENEAEIVRHAESLIRAQLQGGAAT
jgi:8-oxo-dGTP pyrophosphatase MutT (NUDIX family)